MSDDFKTIMVRNVELLWPRLNTTYRYNTAEKRSEPCKPTANGATYSVSWKMDKEQAKALYAECKAHFEARKGNGFTTVFGMKKDEDGSVIFRAKRNGTKGDGTENTPPRVIDGKKAPLEDPAIWTGSRGTIRCTAVPTNNPDGEGGITLLFDTVQVTHAVYGGGGLDDFDEVDTTYAGGSAGSDLDDFDAPAPAAAKPAPAPADDLGDDIPF
jgi:hypothetical protein